MLLGRLDSFVVTAAAGLTIGMLQSAALHFTSTNDWFPDWVPDSGLQQGLPFVVILVALALSGARLPTRGALARRHQRRRPATQR